MSMLDSRKMNESLMNKFTSQKKELLREIGGLPLRILSQATNTFRHSSSGPNPFRINKD